MYTDKKRKRWPLVALACLAILAAVLVWQRTSQVSRQDLSEESAAALKDAIERGALQCYVVEGVYPPSLSYLEENYGLQVNTKDFYVTYDIFASNLPPDVQVIGKH